MKSKFILTPVLSLAILSSCSTRTINPLALPNDGIIINDFNLQKDLIKINTDALIGKDAIGIKTEYSNSFFKLETTVGDTTTNFSFNLSDLNLEGKITGLSKSSFDEVEAGFALSFSLESSLSSQKGSTIGNVNASINSLPKLSYTAYFYLKNSVYYMDISNLKNIFDYTSSVSKSLGFDLLPFGQLESYKIATPLTLDIPMPLTTKENLSTFIDKVYTDTKVPSDINDIFNLLPDLESTFLQHDDLTYSISTSLNNDEFKKVLTDTIPSYFELASLDVNNLSIDVNESASPYKTVFIADSNGPKSFGNVTDMRFSFSADITDIKNTTVSTSSKVSLASSSLFVFDENATMKEFNDNPSDYLQNIQ